jgi:hypothetical protein
VKSLLNYIPGNKNLVMWAAPSAPILAPILAPIVHGSDRSWLRSFMAPIIRSVLFSRQKKSARPHGIVAAACGFAFGECSPFSYNG